MPTHDPLEIRFRKVLCSLSPSLSPSYQTDNVIVLIDLNVWIATGSAYMPAAINELATDKAFFPTQKRHWAKTGCCCFVCCCVLFLFFSSLLVVVLLLFVVVVGGSFFLPFLFFWGGVRGEGGQVSSFQVSFFLSLFLPIPPPPPPPHNSKCLDFRASERKVVTDKRKIHHDQKIFLTIYLLLLLFFFFFSFFFFFKKQHFLDTKFHLFERSG